MLSPLHYRKLSKQLRPVCIQEANAEPVTLADYQLFVRNANLNIPQNVFDKKIRAARRLVEKHLGRALVSKQFNAIMDLPPGIEWTGGGAIGSILARFEGYIPTALELPYAPLRAVNQIFVTDDNGANNVCPSSIYWVSSAIEPARIALRQTQVWPDTLGRSFETFTVQYGAGYAIPFTASGYTLTTVQPHGLVNGQLQRLWTNSDGELPAPFEENVDYIVINASAKTFSLSADGVTAIVTTDAGTGNAFAGEIPENFIRAIVATMSADIFPDKKKATRFDVSEAGSLPAVALQKLELDRIMNL